MILQEIILHTLFQSGITQVQDLERYIKDDVVRHGNRLNDLEKKLVNAYDEMTTTEAIDDDVLFANEDDEEESAFVMYASFRDVWFILLTTFLLDSQGTVYRRHWRRLSWLPRTWYCSRARSVQPHYPKAASQEQGQECEKGRRVRTDVRLVTL